MAEHPKPTTYKSKSGNTYCYDARKLLAIDDVDIMCDNIVQVAKDGCEAICTKIGDVQIGKETLCVADSSLEPALEEVNNYIKSITTDGIEPTTERIKSSAAEIFATLQSQEDERAKIDCENDSAAYEASQAEKQAESKE